VDLGRVLFNGVAPNGRRILSDAALAAMREPDSSARSTLASSGSFQGLGWRGFDSRGHRILEHDGGRHNTLSVVPLRNLAVAVMTNGPGGHGLHDELAGHLIDAAL
jgi:CubicO group peptidase (beta-lactamase class C family)